MERGVAAELGGRAAAGLLLVALLPSLLFLGHWQIPVSLAIPGTPYSIGGTPSVHVEGGDHAGHCHADAARCSQAPMSPDAPASNLHELTVALGIAALAMLVFTTGWSPTALLGLGPEVPPPRAPRSMVV